MLVINMILIDRLYLLWQGQEGEIQSHFRSWHDSCRRLHDLYWGWSCGEMAAIEFQTIQHKREKVEPHAFTDTHALTWANTHQCVRRRRMRFRSVPEKAGRFNHTRIHIHLHHTLQKKGQKEIDRQTNDTHSNLHWRSYTYDCTLHDKS